MKFPPRGRIITFTGISHSCFNDVLRVLRSINGGVVPPRCPFAQSSMRFAPVFAAIMAEATLKQAISKGIVCGRLIPLRIERF